MSIAIDPKVAQLASMDAKSTHLQTSVIEAQWQAEQGSQGVLTNINDWQNFYNNPAGMKYGVGAPSDQYAIGETKRGFLVFPTPQAGAKAYAAEINNDVNYAGVRKSTTVHSVNPQAIAVNELAAIASSPWDAQHYAGDGGIQGYELASTYSQVTGRPFGPIEASVATDMHPGANTVGITVGHTISGLAPNGSNAQKVGNALTNAGNSNSLSSFSLKNFSMNTLIVIVGIVFIAFLLYRTVTH